MILYTDEIIKLVSCVQHHACISVFPLLALCLWSFSFHMKVCIFLLTVPTLAILIIVKNQFKKGNGFPASRGLSRRGIFSFLPRRERPLLAGKEMVKTSFFRFSLAVTKALTDTYGLNC